MSVMPLFISNRLIMTELHPQLKKDCLILGRSSLNHLLLMNDANFPWFILVPDRNDISEIYQLSETDQVQLTQESAQLAKTLMQLYKGDKMNIAALGNIVPQLHIHHVVRFRDDPAWPAPIWGKLPIKHYTESELDKMTMQLKQSGLDQFAFI